MGAQNCCFEFLGARDRQITNGDEPIIVLPTEKPVEATEIEIPQIEGRAIVLLFEPLHGAVKDMASPVIQQHLNIPCLGIKNLIAAGTMKQVIGPKEGKILKDGGHEADKLLAKLVKARTAKPDCRKGFVLEGFPSNPAQAKLLDLILWETGDKVSFVFDFPTPFEILKERVCSRWVHEESGRYYHLKFNPPKSLGNATPSPETMLDDITEEPLKQPFIDTAEGLKKGLDDYLQETEPILARYKSGVHRIDGNQPMEKVWGDILAVLPQPN